MRNMIALGRVTSETRSDTIDGTQVDPQGVLVCQSGLEYTLFSDGQTPKPNPSQC
jgi:hypothetical protein